MTEQVIRAEVAIKSGKEKTENAEIKGLSQVQRRHFN